jgi:hypothetical protein
MGSDAKSGGNSSFNGKSSSSSSNRKHAINIRNALQQFNRLPNAVRKLASPVNGDAVTSFDRERNTTMTKYNLSTRRMKVYEWGGAVLAHTELVQAQQHVIDNAATSLSGDIESVDSKVQNVLSTMFPSDLSKQPASAEMERLTLELDDLETHRQELVALEVEASVYLSCKY